VNKSEVALRDVEVRLTNLNPCPHDFNATGGNLHWEHDNPPEGQSHLTKQSIPSTKQNDNSDARFVDVLRCFWPDKKEEMQYTQLQICHVVPGVPHDQEQESISRTLRFEVQGDGPPRLTLL
jgi:hypothetical protein